LKYRLRRAIDTLIQLILILLPNKVRKRLTYKRKVNDKEDIPRVERLRKELELRPPIVRFRYLIQLSRFLRCSCS